MSTCTYVRVTAIIDKGEFRTVLVFCVLKRVKGFRTFVSHRGLHALGAFQDFVKVMLRFGNLGHPACCAVQKSIDRENERCFVQI